MGIKIGAYNGCVNTNYIRISRAKYREYFMPTLISDRNRNGGGVDAKAHRSWISNISCNFINVSYWYFLIGLIGLHIVRLVIPMDFRYGGKSACLIVDIWEIIVALLLRVDVWCVKFEYMYTIPGYICEDTYSLRK